MTKQTTVTITERWAEPLESGAALMDALMQRKFELVDVKYADPSTGRPISLLGRLRDLEARLAELERGRPMHDAAGLAGIVRSLGRIAEALAPEPQDLVDYVYIAGKLGCTVTWVAEMVRDGKMPRSCIVPGTGNGKPWKFYREKVEAWIASR